MQLRIQPSLAAAVMLSTAALLRTAAANVLFEGSLDVSQSEGSKDPVVKAHMSGLPSSVLDLGSHTFGGNVLHPSGGRHTTAHWVVVFCPSWFEPCQQMEEPFKSMAAEWQGTLNRALLTREVRFARVDCASEKVLCNEEDVDQYPMVHHYFHGDRVATWRGSRGDNLKRLKKWLGQQLKSAAPATPAAGQEAADFRAILRSYVVPPGERAVDVLLVLLVLGLNVRLICSNPGLSRKAPGGDRCACQPAGSAKPGDTAQSRGAAGVARFLPDQWHKDRRAMEL